MAALVTTATVVLMVGSSADAERKPTPEQLKRELAELQKDYDAIVGDYNANRVALEDARAAEEQAGERLATAEQTYEDARRQVTLLATLSYQGAPSNAGIAFGDAEPHERIHTTALLHQRAAENNAAIIRLEKLRDQRLRAEESATDKRQDLQKRDKTLRTQRDEADDTIDKIKKKIDQLVLTPSGRRPNGTWVPQLPDGPDYITPRTRLIRDQVKERFSLPDGVGCYRSLQDGGEHPLGRACDFMITSGGTWPTPAEAALGDRLAAWAIENSRRLGVKYVIYRQRIWQGSGWRSMSNRGGVTANHQDHVHISMY
ncbi:coiled-coil domain-containing protein [Herbidospora mongoliensis]|uniref:coiled-coil domain-containing protein n=1 Tax=Herbidospora mongoliensis TaxID=688067 RepID=UPI0008329B0D|nr:hypothetical protein [Herbidospora mongoliensis]